MAMRTLGVLGISTVVAGGLLAAEPPRSEVNGRATPVIVQDHYLPEAAPPPRLLPQQILDANPSKTTPPTAVNRAGNVIGLQVPGVPTPYLDIPISRFSSGPTLLPFSREGEQVNDWKPHAAFDVAEMHFQSCDIAEARKWYQEVMKLAPKSKFAIRATERLNQTAIIPAAAQSREPPLADPIP